MSDQTKLPLPEEAKLKYFKIKSSTVEEMKDLLGSIKGTKEQDMQQRIKELEDELKHLRNTKKYGLVWDSEKEPEQVVVDCQKKLPILEEVKDRKIISNDSGDSNLLIEGDNYHSLQVLSYTHKEAIDVIYADPPYNTGATDWKYNNDYVLNDDTYRHSKWLNFMDKRLRLAKELLKSNGIICVTIDDYELPTLWLLLDEIFGEDNHLGTVTIRNYPSGRKTKRKIAQIHEYAIFFGKSVESEIKKLEVDLDNKSHKYVEDTDGRFYSPTNLRKQGIDSQAERTDGTLKDRYFPIYVDSQTGKVSTKNEYDTSVYPIDPKGEKRIWRRGKEVIDKMYKDGEIWAKKTKSGLQIYFKFRGGLSGEPPKSMWMDAKYSASEHGTRILYDILNKREAFPYPKSINAVKECLKIMSDSKGSTILDFFAGSGTTGQAVLELNKLDNGNRSFILCTNNESNICEEVTYERIKRISQGYINGKNEEVEGLGGNLRYYKTAFVEVENLKEITDEKKLELTYNAGELLAIKEGVYNEKIKTQYGQVFENSQDIVAIYFKESTIHLEEMALELAEIQKEKGGKVIWYIYGNPFQLNAFPMVKNLELKDIPDPILKVYREINKV